MNRRIVIAGLIVGIALLPHLARAQEIRIDVNLNGSADVYCLGSGELSFTVSNKGLWEPVAYCFFQERIPGGAWADLVEIDDNGVLVAPYWADRISSRPPGIQYMVPVPEDLLVPDGREGTFRVFCGLLEAGFEGPNPESGRTPDNVRSDALEQLRSVSFEDLITSSIHWYSREFHVRRCPA